MFITRKQYEKNIRKAKKKATKKAVYIMDTQKEMQEIRREMYRMGENMDERNYRAFRKLEDDVARIKKELGIE